MKGEVMKKLLKSFFVFFIFYLTILHSSAQLIDKNDYIRIQRIGNKLIKSNNIQHRYTFNFTNILRQGACPILFDSNLDYINDLNLHNNREISIYFVDYVRLSTDDEVAGLIAHELAQGEHSYTGVLNGQFMFTKNGTFPLNFIAKQNELNYDKQAVDFLKKAGYNPSALASALNKTTGEWRGTFFGRHNKTEKRVKNIKRYISKGL